MTSQPLAAIIFDFDGVLVDTEMLHLAAFQAVAETIGVSLTREDYYRRYLGLADRECLAALCAAAARPASPGELDRLVERKRREFARLSRHVGLYPGVREVLEHLHAGFLLAIASGAFHDEIETILQRAGVRGLFVAIVGADDVRAGKPAPDPFVHALRAINQHAHTSVAAAQCIVVEDSARGITAAHAAGMRCVAVATSHERAELADAEVVIAHLRDLRVEDLPA